jgi:riboflavin biosynthesis pyrimidine reductase
MTILWVIAILLLAFNSPSEALVSRMMQGGSSKGRRGDLDYFPIKTALKSTSASSSSSSSSSSYDDDDDDKKSTGDDGDEDKVATTTTTTTTGGVTLKLAFDSQWSVADLSSEKSERFTSEESLDMVHRLRRCSDAVLVGRSTVEVDDCSLTVRRVPPLIVLVDEAANDPPRPRPQPIRVVVDSQKRLQLENYKIATDGLPTIIIVHCSDNDNSCSNQEDQFPQVSFVGLPLAANENDNNNDNNNTNGRRLSSRDITQILQSQHGIQHLMVEGGPQTALGFLEEGVVDRAILVHAPLEFKEPLQSHMSESTLRDAGLECLGDYMAGGDRISCWSRPDLDWPASPLSSWP